MEAACDADRAESIGIDFDGFVAMLRGTERDDLAQYDSRIKGSYSMEVLPAKPKQPKKKGFLKKLFGSSK